jgi:hypothetical protein
MELSPWIPFLSALAGGVIASVATVGGIWLTGKQRRRELAEERRVGRVKDLDQLSSVAISESASFVLQAGLYLLTRPTKEALEELEKAHSSAVTSLVLLAISHPSDEIWELCDKLTAYLGVAIRECVFVEAGDVSAEAAAGSGGALQECASRVDELTKKLRDHRQASLRSLHLVGG